jgi:hypothetical protein
VLRRHAGEDPDHVLVLRTLGAPERRWLRGRRAKKVEPRPEPEPVVTARVTLIDAIPLDGAEAAEDWLKRADGESLAEEAVRRLNRVVHLHRVAVAEPAVREVARDQALAVRVGYGAGEEVAEGRYAAAVELPPPRGERARRAAVLRPQERLAALLSGRDAALACEELVLRARADLTAGRPREAALSLRPALEAAIAELEPWAERGDLRARLEELARLRSEAVGTYERALEGGLDDEETARVDRVLGRVEAALRARTAGGIE